MLENIKTDIDKILLVLRMKKKNSVYLAEIDLFLFLKPKVV